jgi:hypothetical protein
VEEILDKRSVEVSSGRESEAIYMIYAYTQRLSLSCAINAAGAGCKVRLAVRGLQERHLYSSTHFKLNRAAALVEWRQLLSA